MITVKENTTLVGVSELREGIDKILKKTAKGVVVIEKRRKPAAVLMSNKEYEKMKSLIDSAEDLVLGFLAQERMKKAKSSDFINIEEIL